MTPTSFPATAAAIAAARAGIRLVRMNLVVLATKDPFLPAFAFFASRMTPPFPVRRSRMAMGFGLACLVVGNRPLPDFLVGNAEKCFQSRWHNVSRFVVEWLVRWVVLFLFSGDLSIIAEEEIR